LKFLSSSEESEDDVPLDDDSLDEDLGSFLDPDPEGL